jgi:hypothetical protein
LRRALFVLEAQNQIDFVVVGRIMDEQSLGVREQSEAMPERDFPLSVRLNAKWGPPRLARAFDRQRLLDELDRLTARQCTWLVAPGGYGKTYLLQSYIKARQRPALWYNLDEGDSDVVGFFSDFCEALERVGLGPLLRLSPEVQSMPIRILHMPSRAARMIRRSRAKRTGQADWTIVKAIKAWFLNTRDAGASRWTTFCASSG